MNIIAATAELHEIKSGFCHVKLYLRSVKMKIFIDGKAGTTGLRIYERLASRDDVELIVLDDEKRKDTACRKQALNSADVAFLCLPDAAAEEAVALIDNPDTVVIDTSTAHRTADGWAYGFPELSAAHEAKIASSGRIAVPGCHASGFIALVYPLIEAGALKPDALLTCFSLTGYSGGGKKMIAEYEESTSPLLKAPRQYALGQTHKHLKEMAGITGLASYPAFCPTVDDFYSGMEVTVPIFSQQVGGLTKEEIADIYRKKYTGDIVCFRESSDEGGFLSAAALSGKDSMNIAVCGNDERMLLTAVYDNLGKGASGAALECLNIVSNKAKSYGLDI